MKLSAQPPRTTATLPSQTRVSLRMSRYLCHTFTDSLAQVRLKSMPVCSILPTSVIALTLLPLAEQFSSEFITKKKKKIL